MSSRPVPGTLPDPGPDAASPQRRSGTRFELRRAEWLILAFLIYTPALAFILPVASSVEYRLSVWNLSVITIYTFLIYFHSRKPMLVCSVLRDWMPLGVVLLAYREVGWLALAHTGSRLESYWVTWDRLILRGGGKAAIEVFGPVLPSALEIAYTLVFALAPFSIAILYIYRRRLDVDRFLFTFVLGVLLCYVQFPLWPSEPPRLLFFGQDFPAYDTVFRRFNWWMLANYGIHTSVFPSAHVAGAFAAAFGMRQAVPDHRWASRLLLVVATAIAIATVYGRYHYLADAVAGFSMAGFAAALQAYIGGPLPHPEANLIPAALTEEG